MQLCPAPRNWAIAPLEIQEVSIQRLFEVWQDLAYETTGCNTEWGHPILLDDIVQALGITNHGLLQQLAQQKMLELELISGDSAMTFHNPV